MDEDKDGCNWKEVMGEMKSWSKMIAKLTIGK